MRCASCTAGEDPCADALQGDPPRTAEWAAGALPTKSSRKKGLLAKRGSRLAGLERWASYSLLPSSPAPKITSDTPRSSVLWDNVIIYLEGMPGEKWASTFVSLPGAEHLQVDAGQRAHRSRLAHT